MKLTALTVLPTTPLPKATAHLAGLCVPVMNFLRNVGVNIIKNIVENPIIVMLKPSINRFPEAGANSLIMIVPMVRITP
jgi:hypothetical protein